MKILIIGPYFQNNKISKHNAEVGVYEALKELGYEVSLWDHRSEKYLYKNEILEAPQDCSNKGVLVDAFGANLTLCMGPGLTDEIAESSIFEATKGSLRVLWNSEPIRLKNYKERIQKNKDRFNIFFTFDESEVPLYRNIGIEALWLPQAFNPSWYKPLDLPRSQKFSNALCFIGSVGGKWINRQWLLERARQENILVHCTSVFDAEKVNQIYNIHDGVLNLGLYCPESGPVENFKAFGLQQRIFETIGAGQICITNAIPTETNKLFEHGKNILFYNKNNFKEICEIVFDKKEKKKIQDNVLKIRENHTYSDRMLTLIDVVQEKI